MAEPTFYQLTFDNVRWFVEQQTRSERNVKGV